MTRKRSPTDFGPIYLEIQESNYEISGNSESVDLGDVIRFKNILHLKEYFENHEGSRSVSIKNQSNPSENNFTGLLYILLTLTNNAIRGDKKTAEFTLNLASRGKIIVSLELISEEFFYHLMPDTQVTECWIGSIKDQLSRDLGSQLHARVIVEISRGATERRIDKNRVNQAHSFQEAR